MRELTIEEINGMEDGEAIPSVRGTIKAVYEKKETGGQYPGTAQNAILEHDGKKIGLRVENHDDISHLKGKEVVISCWKNDRGMNGVKVHSGSFTDNEGNEKSYHKIKVTKVGTFTVAGDQGAPPEGQESPKPSEKTAKTPAPKKGGELHTKKRLMQLVYLDMMCERAVQAETEKLAESGITVTPEEKMAKVGRFFISLTQKPYSEAVDYSADLPSNKYPELTNPEKKDQPKKEEKEPEPPKQEKQFPPQPAVPEEAPHPDDDMDSDVPF